MAAKFLKPFRFGKGVLSFISTRKAGNLSFYTGDNRQRILRNRKLLAGALKIDPEQLISADQVHGNMVKMVGRKKASLKHVDAMVTNVPGRCLMITVADCVPLLFYDPRKKVIGAAHAGWRGTALNIAQKTVKSMLGFGSRPKDIKIGIGPAIGKCCYEVGPEVAAKFGKKYRIHLDLQAENRQQLLNTGIPAGNIRIYKACTRCNSDSFFSARASLGSTGRFAAGIMLK